MLKQALNIHDRWPPSKTLERAYGIPDVIEILNEIFLLTQGPVMDLEQFSRAMALAFLHQLRELGIFQGGDTETFWEAEFERGKERRKHSVLRRG